MKPISQQFVFISSDSERFKLVEDKVTADPSLQWAIKQQTSFDSALSTEYISQASAVIIDYIDCTKEDVLRLKHFIHCCKCPVFALISEAKQSSITEDLLTHGIDDYLSLESLHPFTIKRAIHYIDEKKSLYEQLEQISHFDPLTGIPNRLLFNQRLQFLVSQARSHQSALSLMVLNIDDFTQINHDYGCETGDSLIQLLAQRLQQRLRQSDSIARIGGDEFAITLQGCQNPSEINIIAKKILELLTSPLTIGAHTMQINMSIGVAILRDKRQSADDLLSQCKQALNKAKKSENNAIILFSDSDNELPFERQQLQSELRRALRVNEFELYYQPKIDIETNQVRSVECLLRWPHPDKGMVSPAEFIPAAEDSGLIVPLGYWIIQQACEDMQAYLEAGNAPIDFAVNLSFKQLQDGMFVNTVKRIIEQTGIDPTRLEFELTETAILSNYQQTYTSMMALSELGVTFSLDDFGTGFSSFSHLQQLPISALKIDRSFVCKINDHEDDAIIVKAMIGLAHSLRLSVIAEGVENESQLSFLKQELCDYVQGFYYSPAVDIMRLTEYIEERTRIA